MSTNMQPNAEFLRKLMATFLVEAREHLDALGTGLLQLEKATHRDTQLPLVETIFRVVHCLKGAARAVNAREIERLCQSLEGMTAEIKSGKCALTSEVIDTLHRAVTGMGQRLEAIAGEAQQTPLDKPPDTTPKAVVAPVAIAQPLVKNRQEDGDTIRIASHKLDALFVEVEELLGVKLAYAERHLELKGVAELLAGRERLWHTMQPVLRDLRHHLAIRDTPPADDSAGIPTPSDQAARLLDFLDEDHEHAVVLAARVNSLSRAMIRDRRQLGTMVDRLLDDVKTLLMLPFDTLLAGFPKMLRDMACDLGKEIDFTMHGGDVQIDKRILEKIKDPLRHMLRNSIDHGIETPAQRISCGKTPCGHVVLTITQAAGRIELTLSDDGAGLDPVVVKAAALQAGVITEDEAAMLEDKDVIALVFRSGVSTREQVTTLSGRGLGMAIVAEQVGKVSGTVRIESSCGSGTSIHISLPLTLATLRGTLVRVANREFVIPTANVLRVQRVAAAAVRRVENADSICVDQTTLVLVRLADLLGLAANSSPVAAAASLTVVVIAHGALRVACVVDEVTGEQEVLAKPLGSLLPRVRHLAGATVLGSGQIVPILSAPDLLLGAVGWARAARPQPAGMPHTSARLLVADDSITARTLLQNFLEASGFSVQIAADGKAALAALQNESFDLLVSDVEMPGMDGLDLTKRIRATPQLASLPVVLVTTRDTVHDRSRGMAAGADAYIVKGRFDPTELLAIIASLLRTHTDPSHTNNVAPSDRITAVAPVREDGASRLPAHENDRQDARHPRQVGSLSSTPGRLPVVHDRQDACPPSKLAATLTGNLPQHARI